MKAFYMACVAGCISAACVCDTAEADIATNWPVTYDSPKGAYTIFEPKDRSISDIYAEKLDDGGTTVFKNHFGPRSRIGWLWDMDKSGYDIIGKLNERGQRSMMDALGDSAADTAMVVLPIEEWKELMTGTPWNFFVNLFEGSLGNTVEKRETVVSSTASYANEEESWQKYVKNGVKGGYRLIRKTPYVYVEGGIGRRAKGQRIAVIGIRCYSRIMDTKNMGIMELEPHIAIFLPKNFRFNAGMSYYPTKFDSSGYKPAWSVSIDHPISRTFPVDIAFGFLSNEHDQKAVFSLAFQF